MRATKDSGIEWIGQIPQEWEISRVKYLYDVTLGKMLQPAPKSDDDELCSYMCAANINWSGVDLSVEKKMWFSAKDKESYRLAAGDLLVTEGGDVAVSCIWNDELPECYIQNAVHRVRPKSDASNRYLYYWLSTIKATGYIDLVCNKATLAHFTKDKFDSCVIPVVSADEQHTIANYLDAKCAEIDALIAAKEKTNALLKERRQSIIYEAVTKGLNPDAPMKDSGIEWIGQIPETSNIVRFKYLCDVFGRIGFRGYTQADIVADGEGPITLSPSNIEELGMSFSKCTYLTWDKYNESPEIQVRVGDILLVKTGSSYGKSSIIDSLPMEATINPQLVVIKNIRCNARYLYYCMQTDSFEYQVERAVVGGTIPTMAQEKINNFIVVLPETGACDEIVTYLDRECLKINKMVATNVETIQKLKEYRQSIIYEAVTGKIEV